MVHSCTLLGLLMETGQAYALGGSEAIVNWIPEDGSRVARMPVPGYGEASVTTEEAVLVVSAWEIAVMVTVLPVIGIAEGAV